MRFSRNNEGLGPDYIHLLREAITQNLQATHERTQQQAQSLGCKPRLSVAFLTGNEPIFQKLGRFITPTEKEFSEGILRLDSVGCLEKADPRKVTQIYLSPEYRVKAIAGGLKSEKIGSTICDVTSGFPLILKGSNICSEVTESKIQGGFTVDTDLTWTDPTALEIYLFRTKMSTYESGDLTSFHFTTFARGPNISPLLKSFALQNMKSSQAKAISAMQEFIKK
jgi:hypothetical protein